MNDRQPDEKLASEGASVELSARRTGMSFQRTRLSADRTLMSVIRTALALITFGFTIHQLFAKLKEQGATVNPESVRNFGVSLVVLGVATLVLGGVYHIRFMLGLREERVALQATGLIYAESKFPPSQTLIIAIVLFCLGIAAIVSMVFRIGPFM